MHSPRSHLALATVLLLFASSVTPARGEEVTRRVQEELRRRQLYFGDIDGRSSPEIAAALRRFQARKGFAATGAIDDDTCAALGIQRIGPLVLANAAPALPDVPVLKSDAAREVTEADRQFLEKLEAQGELPPVAEPPDEDLAPEPPPPRRGLAAKEPAASASPVESEELTAAKEFVREYLSASARANMTAEMGFYGDRVSYFDHGQVGRDFIEKDVRRYRERWPSRAFELVQISAAPGREPGETVVEFTLRYELKGARSAAGRTKNAFRVQRSGEGLQIVGMRERRLQK